MATGNSTNVTIEIDGTAGGSLVDFTSQVDKISDVELQNGVIVNTPFGTGFTARAFTGIVDGGTVTVEGEITDGAAGTGVYKTLKAARGGVSRTLKITWMTGEYVSCEALVATCTRTANVGAINRFKAVLHTTGTITES